MTELVPPPAHDIADLGLAPLGRQRIAWAETRLPVLRAVSAQVAEHGQLKGLRVACRVHLTALTAVFIRALRQAGGEVAVTASNSLTTEDDVAAALVSADGVSVYAIRGADEAVAQRHLQALVDFDPQVVIDDQAVLTSALMQAGKLGEVKAGCENTTTGVLRLRTAAGEELPFPMVSVYVSGTTRMLDNRFGTGQSTLDGIIGATGALIAGKRVVVAGYGSAGKGVASRSRGMGANVLVTEIDPVRALEAAMDGYRVVPMMEAADEGDIFITVTGNKDVLRDEHFKRMKDGAILANSGHIDIEIDRHALGQRLTERKHDSEGHPFVEEFRVEGDRRIYAVAEGRLVNLGAAEDHPADVADVALATQYLSIDWALSGRLRGGVHSVPPEVDREVAAAKLAAMGVNIDVLTPDQEAFLRDGQ